MKQMKLTKLTALTMLVAALATSAHAQYLLKIDLSDITNATITTTGNNAGADDDSTSVNAGVDLLGFFTAPHEFGNSLSGSLIGGNSGAAYEYWAPDNFTNDNALGDDLLLFSITHDEIQNFSTTAPAFTGATTLNLSGIASILPSAGAHGDIYSGYSGAPGVLIGQWQVTAGPVPEPGTLALAGLGGVGALFFARRKK